MSHAAGAATATSPRPPSANPYSLISRPASASTARHYAQYTHTTADSSNSSNVPAIEHPNAAAYHSTARTAREAANISPIPMAPLPPKPPASAGVVSNWEADRQHQHQHHQRQSHRPTSGTNQHQQQPLSARPPSSNSSSSYRYVHQQPAQQQEKPQQQHQQQSDHPHERPPSAATSRAAMMKKLDLDARIAQFIEEAMVVAPGDLQGYIAQQLLADQQRHVREQLMMSGRPSSAAGRHRSLPRVLNDDDDDDHDDDPGEDEDEILYHCETSNSSSPNAGRPVSAASHGRGSKKRQRGQQQPRAPSADQDNSSAAGLKKRGSLSGIQPAIDSSVPSAATYLGPDTRVTIARSWALLNQRRRADELVHHWERAVSQPRAGLLCSEVYNALVSVFLDRLDDCDTTFAVRTLSSALQYYASSGSLHPHEFSGVLQCLADGFVKVVRDVNWENRQLDRELVEWRVFLGVLNNRVVIRAAEQASRRQSEMRSKERAREAHEQDEHLESLSPVKITDSNSSRSRPASASSGKGCWRRASTEGAKEKTLQSISEVRGTLQHLHEQLREEQERSQEKKKSRETAPEVDVPPVAALVEPTETAAAVVDEQQEQENSQQQQRKQEEEAKQQEHEEKQPSPRFISDHQVDSQAPSSPTDDDMPAKLSHDATSKYRSERTLPPPTPPHSDDDDNAEVPEDDGDDEEPTTVVVAAHHAPPGAGGEISLNMDDLLVQQKQQRQKQQSGKSSVDSGSVARGSSVGRDERPGEEDLRNDEPEALLPQQQLSGDAVDTSMTAAPSAAEEAPVAEQDEQQQQQQQQQLKEQKQQEGEPKSPFVSAAQPQIPDAFAGKENQSSALSVFSPIPSSMMVQASKSAGDSGASSPNSNSALPPVAPGYSPPRSPPLRVSPPPAAAAASSQQQKRANGGGSAALAAYGNHRRTNSLGAADDGDDDDDDAPIVVAGANSVHGSGPGSDAARSPASLSVGGQQTTSETFAAMMPSMSLAMEVSRGKFSAAESDSDSSDGDLYGSSSGNAISATGSSPIGPLSLRESRNPGQHPFSTTRGAAGSGGGRGRHGSTGSAPEGVNAVGGLVGGSVLSRMTQQAAAEKQVLEDMFPQGRQCSIQSLCTGTASPEDSPRSVTDSMLENQPGHHRQASWVTKEIMGGGGGSSVPAFGAPKTVAAAGAAAAGRTSDISPAGGGGVAEDEDEDDDEPIVVAGLLPKGSTHKLKLILDGSDSEHDLKSSTSTALPLSAMKGGPKRGSLLQNVPSVHASPLTSENQKSSGNWQEGTNNLSSDGILSSGSNPPSQDFLSAGGPPSDSYTQVPSSGGSRMNSRNPTGNFTTSSSSAYDLGQLQQQQQQQQGTSPRALSQTVFNDSGALPSSGGITEPPSGDHSGQGSPSATPRSMQTAATVSASGHSVSGGGGGSVGSHASTMQVQQSFEPPPLVNETFAGSRSEANYDSAAAGAPLPGGYVPPDVVLQQPTPHQSPRQPPLQQREQQPPQPNLAEQAEAVHRGEVEKYERKSRHRFEKVYLASKRLAFFQEMEMRHRRRIEQLQDQVFTHMTFDFMGEMELAHSEVESMDGSSIISPTNPRRTSSPGAAGGSGLAWEGGGEQQRQQQEQQQRVGLGKDETSSGAASPCAEDVVTCLTRGLNDLLETETVMRRRIERDEEADRSNEFPAAVPPPPQPAISTHRKQSGGIMAPEPSPPRLGEEEEARYAVEIDVDTPAATSEERDDSSPAQQQQQPPQHRPSNLIHEQRGRSEEGPVGAAEVLVFVDVAAAPVQQRGESPVVRSPQPRQFSTLLLDANPFQDQSGSPSGRAALRARLDEVEAQEEDERTVIRAAEGSRGQSLYQWIGRHGMTLQLQEAFHRQRIERLQQGGADNFAQMRCVKPEEYPPPYVPSAAGSTSRPGSAGLSRDQQASPFINSVGGRPSSAAQRRRADLMECESDEACDRVAVMEEEAQARGSTEAAALRQGVEKKFRLSSAAETPYSPPVSSATRPGPVGEHNNSSLMDNSNHQQGERDPSVALFSSSSSPPSTQIQQRQQRHDGGDTAPAAPDMVESSSSRNFIVWGAAEQPRQGSEQERAMHDDDDEEATAAAAAAAAVAEDEDSVVISPLSTKDHHQDDISDNETAAAAASGTPLPAAERCHELSLRDGSRSPADSPAPPPVIESKRAPASSKKKPAEEPSFWARLFGCCGNSDDVAEQPSKPPVTENDDDSEMRPKLLSPEKSPNEIDEADSELSERDGGIGSWELGKHPLKFHPPSPSKEVSPSPPSARRD